MLMLHICSAEHQNAFGRIMYGVDQAIKGFHAMKAADINISWLRILLL